MEIEKFFEIRKYLEETLVGEEVKTIEYFVNENVLKVTMRKDGE